MPGQLEEDVFERHRNRFKFEETPVVGDGEAGDIFSDIVPQLTFQKKMSWWTICMHVLDAGDLSQAGLDFTRGSGQRQRNLLRMAKSSRQPIRSIFGNDPASVDNDDSLTYGGRLRENMRASK